MPDIERLKELVDGICEPIGIGSSDRRQEALSLLDQIEQRDEELVEMLRETPYYMTNLSGDSTFTMQLKRDKLAKKIRQFLTKEAE